jgi:hypothetical protein
MPWKQRPIGGIQVGWAFYLLGLAAIGGIVLVATGERGLGAVVIVATLALSAAVWNRYRQQR